MPSGVQTCALDRKSTRLNSSHGSISYAVFCLKKKNKLLKSSHLSISYLLSLQQTNHHTNTLASRGRCPPVRPFVMSTAVPTAYLSFHRWAACNIWWQCRDTGGNSEVVG